MEAGQVEEARSVVQEILAIDPEIFQVSDDHPVAATTGFYVDAQLRERWEGHLREAALLKSP